MLLRDQVREKGLLVLMYIVMIDDPKSSMWSDESRDAAGMG